MNKKGMAERNILLGICRKGFILALFLLPVTFVYAQEEGYRIVSDDWQQLQVEFTTALPQVDQTTIDGEMFSTLTIDGYLPSSTYGSPCLPTFSRLIEVPVGAEFDVKVSGEEYDTIGPLEHWLMPTQFPRRKSDTSAARLFISREVYSWNAFIGDKETVVEPVGIARDRMLARLQFSPVRYNPVSGQVVVCRRATVTVSYRGVDISASQELFSRYHSPAFNSGSQTINNLYPKAVASGSPVRYLIVAHSMFRGHLDTFVQWKRRKGFLTDVVYTDNQAVGSTTTSIAAYLKSQYIDATTANPAPTYVLLVGDVQQIPAFDGTTQYDHITDLYYATWSNGDHIPDCYYGRFSAQTVNQLTPQIAKTLMYEQYTFADPSFLDKAILIAGVDGGNAGDNGYTRADPAMDYAATHYVNSNRGFTEVQYFKNNTSIVPNAPGVTISANGDNMSATVRGYINAGAGWINYSAHGGSTGWGTPNIGNSHVAQMTNTQKFGIMVGNCCQTNMFGESVCFGEALLRRGDYCGAVGYIGGSDYTLWGEDFYWAVGLRSSISATMSMAYSAANLGAYDRLCHTHSEAFSQWTPTQGALIMAGNMAVESSTSGYKHYYWEIYHLMGDPSLMPYLTQPAEMPLTVANSIVYGTDTLQVTTAPYAYVALTDTLNRTLLASGYANANGQLTLHITSGMPFAGYEVASSAQQYRTAFQAVTVLPPQGPCVVARNISTSGNLVADDTTAAVITIKNVGGSTANNINVTLSSSIAEMHFLGNNTVSVASLAAGDSINVPISIIVDMMTNDQCEAMVSAATNWSGATTATYGQFTFTIDAPKPTVTLSNYTLNLMPGDCATLTLTVYNGGHAPLRNAAFAVTSTSSDLTITDNGSGSFDVPQNSSVSRSFNVCLAGSAEEGVYLPLQMLLYNSAIVYDTISHLLTGPAYCETFEGNSYHVAGWVQGENPWQITDSIAYEGSYCLRSMVGLTHNQTSEISITRTVTRIGDSIIFYVKVSSEGSYDKFFFMVDTTNALTLSGEEEWQRVAIPVTIGTHTLHFKYVKDYSVSRGNDCAWIDFVTMPDIPFVDPSSYIYDGRENETFEDNSFHFTDWVQGNHPWFLTTDEAKEGFYSARSASGMNDNETSEMSFTRNITRANDSIIFFVKISSETNYDKFHFLLDGQERYTISGQQDWTRVTVPLTTGNHTFTFKYAKDGSRSYYSDCAWVDLISLPSELVPPHVGIDNLLPNASYPLIYPNPTAGLVNFGDAVDEATVYDINGREVIRTQHIQQIDLSPLPQGVYTIRLTSQGNSSIHKVIKK